MTFTRFVQERCSEWFLRIKKPTGFGIQSVFTMMKKIGWHVSEQNNCHGWDLITTTNREPKGSQPSKKARDTNICMDIVLWFLNYGNYPHLSVWGFFGIFLIRIKKNLRFLHPVSFNDDKNIGWHLLLPNNRYGWDLFTSIWFWLVN